MNKSKLSRSGDRLSELPDSLIFDIFWFLPITDVVRTTKLSRRWRNLWTTAPFLNFSHNDLNNYRVEGALDKVRNIFNRTLILWRGAKLLKFKVMLSCVLSRSLVGDINVWVRFAKEKEVRELYLDLSHCAREFDVIEAEFESVWSCSSLEELSMKGYPFSIGNGNVKWDRLKSLTIDADHFTEDLFSKVFRGSPKLEVFIASHVERGENCYIQSSSLKKLCIKDSYSDTDVRHSEMKIQTPNLETLEISGFPYSKFSMDVAPLTDVTLRLCCLDWDCRCGETDEFVNIKGTLEQILPTIHHVETLTLSACCLQVLGVMNNKSLLSPLSKLKFLKLNTSSTHSGTFSKHLEIAGILQNFPKLERLVIDDGYLNKFFEDENEDDYQDDPESLEFEANLRNSFLLQLRTVEVTWSECDGSIFSFIKTLLKYASKLEKMVFRGHRFRPRSSPSYSLFLASQKLLRMPRSSPTAQLIFCKY